MKMNWVFLVVGIPFGFLAGRLGIWLCKKLKPKSATVEALVLLAPLAIVCFTVVLFDILF